VDKYALRLPLICPMKKNLSESFFRIYITIIVRFKACKEFYKFAVNLFWYKDIFFNFKKKFNIVNILTLYRIRVYLIHIYILLFSAAAPFTKACLRSFCHCAKRTKKLVLGSSPTCQRLAG